MMPLYGTLKGDTLVLVILAEESDTLPAMAQRLQEAATTRIARRPLAEVRFNGQPLDLTLTVAQAGLKPLDLVEVILK